MLQRILLLPALLGIASCATAEDDERPFSVEPVASFSQPWALTFLPDGRMFVTEKGGNLYIVTQSGQKSEAIAGVPNVDAGNQGGLGDVALHPDFATNRLVYLSYAEAGDSDTRGAAIARGTLSDDDTELLDVEVIWRQVPKVPGRGHYAYRMLFSADGYLYVASGERQKFDPAQDMASNLGKILRLNDDGSPAAGNPFASSGGVAAEVWSLGHRNPLGIAFDSAGQLWNVEMGPKGGDELNRVEAGRNYGYPIVSDGDHYNGTKIPNHDTRPEFAAPAITWTPVVSPGGFIVYSGSEFPEWRGDGLIAGLSSQSLVRVELDGESAREVERFDMGTRMRAVTQGPNGAVWMLEDGGRLLKLTSTSWRTPAPENTAYLQLPHGEVIFELAPAFAPKTVANLRTLIEHKYFDGLSVIRSQDNYVVQWAEWLTDENARPRSIGDARATIEPEFFRSRAGIDITPIDSRDAYADHVGFAAGFPVGYDDERAWMTHCYGMVGVARGMEPDSGNGTSLYVITGHAPRHLDRNIALVGRVLKGMEHLSTLPRGSRPLGFYEDEAQLTPITSLYLGTHENATTPPRVLDTASEAFLAYVASRTTRSEDWFIDPVGRIGICNLHPPVK